MSTLSTTAIQPISTARPVRSAAIKANAGLVSSHHTSILKKKKKHKHNFLIQKEPPSNTKLRREVEIKKERISHSPPKSTISNENDANSLNIYKELITKATNTKNSQNDDGVSVNHLLISLFIKYWITY